MGIKDKMMSSAKRPISWALKKTLKIGLFVVVAFMLCYGFAYGIDMLFNLMLAWGSSLIF